MFPATAPSRAHATKSGFKFTRRQFSLSVALSRIAGVLFPAVAKFKWKQVVDVVIIGLSGFAVAIAVLQSRLLRNRLDTFIAR